MSRQNQKNLLTQIASYAGVASASALLSLPAMALTNFHPKNSAQPLDSSDRVAQSQPVSREFLLAEQPFDNPGTNTGSKPSAIQTERGICQIPPIRHNGESTRKRLQAERNCNPGSHTIPSNTNSQQNTPSSRQQTPSSPPPAYNQR